MVEPIDIFIRHDEDAQRRASNKDAQALRTSIIRLTLALYAAAGLMVVSAFVWLGSMFGFFTAAQPELAWVAGVSTMALLSGALWIEQKYQHATADLAHRVLPASR